MADDRSSSLQRELIARLERDYDALPTGSLYQLFAQAVAGRAEAALLGAALPEELPPSGQQEQQERHVAEVLDALLAGPYAQLTDREVNRAFASVALAYDKLVRQRGEFIEAAPKIDTGGYDAVRDPSDGSRSGSDTGAGAGLLRRPARASRQSASRDAGGGESGESPASIADAATAAIAAAAAAVDRTRAEADAARAAKADHERPTRRMDAVTAPPPAPSRQRVSSRTVAFELVWSCDAQTADLIVDDDIALERLALELRDQPLLELPLEPEPMLATAVLLRIAVHGVAVTHTVRAGVRETGAVTELEVFDLPTELGALAQRASKRLRGVLVDDPEPSPTPAPAPDATPFDALFGGDDSGFRIRRGAGDSSAGRSSRPGTGSPSDSSAGRSSRPGTGSPSDSSAGRSSRPGTGSPSDSTTGAPRPADESSLPVTDEDRAASRRRRARVRRGTARRTAPALQDAVGHRPPTPTAGSPVVPAEPPRPRSEARQRAAERRASGATTAVPEANAPPVTESVDAVPPPRETKGGFYRRDSSATDLVTDRSDRRSNSGDSSFGRRESSFGRRDSSFGRREASSGRAASEAFAFRDSWSRDPTPSSIRRQQVLPEPTFGEELGSDEGGAVAGGAATLLLACGARWPSAAVFIVAGGARWRLLLREDLLLDLHVEPEDPRFDVVSLLRDSGMVSEDDIEDALHAAQDGGLGLLEELSRARKLRYREVDALQTSRWRLMLEALFDDRVDRWEVAGFEFVELRGSAPVEYASMAWERLVARVDDEPQDTVEALLHDRFAERPRFRSDARLTPRSLGLDSRARKLVEENLDGSATAREVMARSPLRKRATMSVLVALDEIGLIDWQTVNAQATRVGHALPALRKKLEEIERNDVYAALDTHWSSDEALLLEAWRRIVRVLDLELVLQHGDEGARALAERVQEGLLRLRDGLKTRERRDMMRAKLTDEFEIGAAVQLYVKQAEIALFKRDAEAAEDALRRVVELDPDDAESARRLEKVLAFQAREREHTPGS